MKIAICDDEPIFIEKLKKLVNEYFDGKGITISMDTYLNGVSLSVNCSKGVDYDLILLDIEMPDMSGADVVAYLKKNNKNIPVIFISSKKDYGDIAVELRVYRYIYKINIDIKLKEALDSLLDCLISRTALIDVEDTEGRSKIKISNILYLKSCEKAIDCYLIDGRIVQIKKSLTELENDVAFCRFVRIHKSILVNSDRSCLENKKIILDNNQTIDISRSRRQYVINKYMDLMADRA